MNGEEWYEHYKAFAHGKYPDDETHKRYGSLPEVAVTAFTEAGLSESSISVPYQRRYQGTIPVIPSDLSSIPCSRLGAAGVLNKLNIILGTSYTLHMAWLHSLLEIFVTHNSDFGTAYAHLRPYWSKGDFADVEDELRRRKELDRRMREDVLVNKRIIRQYVPPRHVWDLYSNRVVPWWVARPRPHPISHAWVDEKDRVDVMTRINGEEWPVPIPKDAHLNLIRIEMLNVGAEYAWLDVLCLRQVHGLREDLRVEEWKVDVPTIGAVYIRAHVANPVTYYFNGLGRPLHFKAGDFESDRSWFRRVWTLQEISRWSFTCGDTGDVNAMEDSVRTEFDRQIQLMKEIRSRSDMFFSLSLMRHRVCTKPIDKVAGLVYLLGWVDAIPAYYEMQSLEDAWATLVDVVWPWHRGTLFYMYHKPGTGNKVWRPSWSQLMDMDHVLPRPETENWYPLYYLGNVEREESDDGACDRADVVCIKSGYVQGLAEGSHDGKYRWGELIVEDDAGERHTFKINANHQYHILDGPYTLLGNVRIHYGVAAPKGKYWVVGQRLVDRRFKKLSIFHIPDKNDVKRLKELGISVKEKAVLA